MPKTKNHLYFEVDEGQGLVIVHAIFSFGIAPRQGGAMANLAIAL